jgi:hypothetical protein
MSVTPERYYVNLYNRLIKLSNGELRSELVKISVLSLERLRRICDDQKAPKRFTDYILDALASRGVRYDGKGNPR